MYSLQLFLLHLTSSPAWVAVDDNVKVDYNWESNPLQIKTTAPRGGDGYIDLDLWTEEENYIGCIYWKFLDFEYRFQRCTTEFTKTFPDVPEELEKIWTVKNTPGTRTLIIFCNDVKLIELDLDAVDSAAFPDCSGWYQFSEVTKVDIAHSQSAWYRAAPGREIWDMICNQSQFSYEFKQKC